MDVEQTQAEETQEQATETETPATEETAPEEVAAASEEAAGGEGEPAKEGEATPEQTAAKEAEKHKRAGGWQRKIERLERELAAAKERELQQLRAGQGQPAAAGKEKTPEEKAAEYIEGVVSKRLEQREAQQEQARTQAEFHRRTAEVRAAHPDFDDVVMSVSDVPVSPAVREALLTSEYGGEMMYQLAKNPVELARISALPPLVAAREIGRLEARASSTASPKAPIKSAIRPPAPPTNVNGSKSSTRDLDDLPISDYKRALRSRGR